MAIQKNGSGSLIGSDVIVTDDGLILTCYHVVGNIETKTLDKIVDVYFPETKVIKSARVVEKYCDPVLDVAFLSLQDNDNDNDYRLQKYSAASIGRTVYSGHDFRSFGFRKPLEFKGLLVEGKIRGVIQIKTKEGIDNLAR